MSFFRSLATFFGIKQKAEQAQKERAQERKQSPAKDKPRKLSDHEKLERFYRSCGLKKWPIIAPHPLEHAAVLNGSGQPLHLYALNERNYRRKLKMFWTNSKSIPTFA